MDEAAVIELFVAGVAEVVVLGAAAEGIAVVLAEGLGGGGVRTLAPGIEGLALAGGDGEGFRCLVPSGGEKEVGGAEVVGEDVGEFYAGSCCGDGSGINDGTQIVAMEGFGGDGGGGGIGRRSFFGPDKVKGTGVRLDPREGFGKLHFEQGKRI